MLTLRSWLPGICVMLACSGASMAQEKSDESRDAPAAKSPKEIFAELDKNKDGVLTSEEVAEDKKRFFERVLRVGDADKNGKLTVEEFAEGFKPDELRPADTGRRGDGRGQPFDPEAMFRRLDTNKDGKLTVAEAPEYGKELVSSLLRRAGKESDAEITRDEYLRNLRGGRPAGMDDPAEAFKGLDVTFKRLDVNGDGKLTASEVPERAREFAERLLERAGKGKDGELTQEEYLRVVRAFSQNADERSEQFFKRIDVNGDGKITIDEAPDQAKELVANLLKAAGKGRDGELTAEDIRRYGRPGGGMGMVPPGGFGGNLLIRKLDVNSDGRLSKEELARAADHFEELDRNKDGQLDPRELFAPFRGNADGRPEGRGPAPERREDRREGEKKPGSR